jgi:SNF family Na+-dependent transporter
MPWIHRFVGFGSGSLLFLTFAVVGVTFNLVLDAVMRHFVSPDLRHRVGPTAAVTAQVLATIYAVLVAFVIVNEYSQLRSANEQVATKAADLSAMYETTRIFPTAEGAQLRASILAYTKTVVNHAFPKLAVTSTPDTLSDQRIEEMFRRMRAIHPATPDETAAYNKSLDLLDGVVETRARLVNASRETVPWPLVILLAIMGLAVLVVSTLLDTQDRRSHVAILTALALLVSLTLALVVSMNFPFDGILPISDGPLRNFLAFRANR